MKKASPLPALRIHPDELAPEAPALDRLEIAQGWRAALSVEDDLRRPIWCKAFLLLLEETGGKVAISADRAGVHRNTVLFRRRMDASFRSDCDAVFDRLATKRAEECLRQPSAVSIRIAS